MIWNESKINNGQTKVVNFNWYSFEFTLNNINFYCNYDSTESTPHSTNWTVNTQDSK